MQKKERKVTSGPIRDKSRTKTRMIAAVGAVILKNGYSGLSAINIAAEAGVDTRLVNLYFKNVNHLIEEYLHRRASGSSNLNLPEQKTATDLEAESNLITNWLVDYSEVLNKDLLLQNLIHWEMGESSKLLRTFADKREQEDEKFLSIYATHFEKSDVDIRATVALLIGGINYLTLHGRVNGSTCAGINIYKARDRERILKAISDILNRLSDTAKANALL